MDGILGTGLNPTSTGGDQAVDAFFASLPANFQRLTFSRKAYCALSVPPDPGAPSANLDFVGDWRCMKVRGFDANGTQNAYVFSLNGAWQILDIVLRKMIKPEWKPVLAAAAGGDLTADEKARIDFPSVVDSAAWCDFQISAGVKRWESSVAFPRTIKMQQAVAQMQTMSQLFVHEAGGKIYIRADKPRAYSFLLTADHIMPGTAKFDEVDLHGTDNRIVGTFNDLKPMKQADIDTAGNNGIVRSGGQVTVKTVADHPFLTGDNVQIFDHSTDAALNNVWPVSSVPDTTHFVFAMAGANETVGGGSCGTPESRFAQRAPVVDHEHHQVAIGARGLNLSPMFRVRELNIDFGNNTFERVMRAMSFLKIRGLGPDTVPYKAPWTCNVTASFYAVDAMNRALVAQRVGEIIRIDSSISEEFADDYEILDRKIVLPAAGSGQGQPGASASEFATIELKLLQYIPSAFSDASIADTGLKASITRRGLAPLAVVDSKGVQRLSGTFRNNPVNCFGIFTGGNPLTQSGTTTRVNVAACTKQFGDGQVSYNSGSVDPGSLGTWDVYGDDPTWSGGALTYQATQGNHTLTGANGRIYFGTITTISGGGASGVGGGDGDVTPPVH